MGLGWSDGTPACLITFPTPFYLSTDVLQTNKGGFCQQTTICLVSTVQFLFSRFSSSDYWFNQMYYGTHGPFKRAEGGQAITFENDKVLFSSHSIIYDTCKWHFCCPGQSLPTYDNIIWKWILGSDTSHQYHCSLVKTIKGFIFSRPEVQLQGLWSLE